MKALRIIVLLFVSTGLNAQSNKGLKDFYKDYFVMGVAVSPQSLKTDEAELILQQFGSLTAENVMKMGPIHPKENEFNWAPADSIAAFAQRNNLKLRGHTLCWHNQTPDWLFKNAKGDTVSKEVLLKRLKDHITAVVTRYKGNVYAWDVVNEVISDSKNEFYRKSPWFNICGKEFIALAFRWAHDADPDALLFYNDYNESNPVKREKIFKLVKELKDAGVPIHGLGLQAHWNLEGPSPARIDSAITRYEQLGLNLQITELDVRVHPWVRRNQEPPAGGTPYTPEKEKQQTEYYKNVFDVFRKHRNTITGITFWNISDRKSWMDNPFRGTKTYPLLFDQDLKPKKAYMAITNF